MSAFLGVPVDAAYHLVTPFVSVLTPLFGGLAAAVAIVGFTVALRLLLLPLSYRAARGMAARARVAPQALALRHKHAGQPDRLQRELAALHAAEGTSMFAGCLPQLAPWPVLSVLYLLFRSPRIAGAPNTLLAHRLFVAPLASYWLGGTGPVSAQGAVFAGLFVLLAVIGWLSARSARRLGGPAGAGLPAAPRGSGGPPGAERAHAALARVLPFSIVPVAALVPLAAGLYLATSAAWTLAERTVFGRLRAPRPAVGPRSPAG